MKKTSITVVFLLLFSLAAFAQAPRLEKPVAIRLVDGSIIDVGNSGFASSGYHDMDGDGLRDLLVGELANDVLRVYKNYGSAAEPVFTGFRFFQTTEGLAVTDTH